MRWHDLELMFDNSLPNSPSDLHRKTPQTLKVLSQVCTELCNHADGGETLYGESLPKAKRGDGLRLLSSFIKELKDDSSAGARMAEQFLAVLLPWLFPDFAHHVGCKADVFAHIERDLFGEQRRGKTGARSSIVRPALHPIELWAKYAAVPL
ncbi:MAG: hypothetical protein CL678_01015 [Bdellovibrionaceae bacterium]|nr:hypothetical protein [Pseudobdellovibrionaceae bacterium]